MGWDRVSVWVHLTHRWFPDVSIVMLALIQISNLQDMMVNSTGIMICLLNIHISWASVGRYCYGIPTYPKNLLRNITVGAIALQGWITWPRSEMLRGNGGPLQQQGLRPSGARSCLSWWRWQDECSNFQALSLLIFNHVLDMFEESLQAKVPFDYLWHGYCWTYFFPMR